LLRGIIYNFILFYFYFLLSNPIQTNRTLFLKKFGSGEMIDAC